MQYTGALQSCEFLFSGVGMQPLLQRNGGTSASADDLLRQARPDQATLKRDISRHCFAFHGLRSGAICCKC